MVQTIVRGARGSGLVSERPGWFREVTGVVVEGGRDREVVVREPRRASAIAATFADEEGKPVAGVQLDLVSWDHEGGSSDAAGRLSIGRVEGGTYDYRLRTEGTTWTFARGIEVPEDTVATPTWTVGTRKVRGLVRLEGVAEGNRRMDVALHVIGRDGRRGRAAVGADGSFVVSGLVPGQHRLVGEIEVPRGKVTAPASGSGSGTANASDATKAAGAAKAGGSAKASGAAKSKARPGSVRLAVDRTIVVKAGEDLDLGEVVLRPRAARRG
jgi:hypothetical protein